MHVVDLSIIIGYLILVIVLGFWISQKASKNLRTYFLGDNKIPWYVLGLSNASGMFDISGSMWTVTILFVYGLKSAWIPWLWPVWNQIFVMIFLALWLRRSGVLTGAEWINFRFGNKLDGKLSHIIVTIFAIISVFGFLAYFFVGIGKFATIFFPWDLSVLFWGINFSSEQIYAMIIIAITTLYTIKGGMYSVVFTEVLQFIILTISCLVIGYIALTQIAAGAVQEVVPDGWGNIFFGWELDLDWSGYIDQVNEKIDTDGFGLFGYLFMMMIFKGIFASLAGPVPSYDMQRVLSTRSPQEAAKMSGFTILVLFFPRYLLVAGLGALALVFLTPELVSASGAIDLELILPLAIERFVPVGFKGLLLAGLLAAFMGTFAAFINAAPAYVVNDLYKKYFHPAASNAQLIKLSYVSTFILVLLGIVGGLFAESINSLTVWITSALYGGYAAANFLKWIWWRFNGWGYFAGMLAGLIASTFLPILWPDTNAIYLFPVLFAFSLLGCFLGTYLGSPTDTATLINFYSKTRPWGFWKPIFDQCQDKVLKNPNLQIGRDSINVLVGIAWQMSLVIMPIYLIIKDFKGFAVSALIFIVTSIFLKVYWYNTLKD